jgi:hypothetical protein
VCAQGEMSRAVRREERASKPRAKGSAPAVLHRVQNMKTSGLNGSLLITKLLGLRDARWESVWTWAAGPRYREMAMGEGVSHVWAA